MVPIVKYCNRYCKVLQYFGIATSQSIVISVAKSLSIAILIAKFSNIAKYESIANFLKYCKKYCKILCSGIFFKLCNYLLNFDWYFL